MDLEALLHSFWRRGQGAWGDLVLDEREFLDAARRTLELEDDFDILANEPGRFFAEDFYLACACASRLPRALAVMEERYLPGVLRSLSAVSAAPMFVDDALQRLRESLFLGAEGGAPQIQSYRGRGPLTSWLRICATRLALKLKTRGRPADTDAATQDELAQVASDEDLELYAIQDEYRAEFKRAFQEAFAKLSARDKNLLRMQILEGLSVDQVATLYRVHRGSASRWLTTIRRFLLEETRRTLTERLHTTEADVDDLLELTRSQLDVSLSRLLRETPPSE
jgi:RNA polymerase sigma-70 factor (ECF subfamily)